MTNPLKSAHVNWALKHLAVEGDTDLFPWSFEIEVLRAHASEVVNKLLHLDVLQHKWSEPRRALVPTGHVALRPAAQLDPFDAVLLAALVRSCASTVEKYRGDPQVERIFSYRVASASQARFYRADMYKQFWQRSKQLSAGAGVVLSADISDFYNQIYHHTVEQEFAAAKVNTSTIKAIVNLLKTCSMTTSRGLPIGPHAAHLIAELSLHPIDEMLVQLGAKYVRFVDDMHIFCKDEREARVRLYKLAEALDIVKLQLNRTKTNIVDAAAWAARCEAVLEDQPINDEEAQTLSELSGVGADPYDVLGPAQRPPGLDRVLTPDTATSIFEAYLAEPQPDFVRLRWFIRRLTHTGSAAAVEYVVENFERLAPAIAEVVRYLRASITDFQGDHEALGEKLIRLLDEPITASSPYLRSMVLSIFATVSTLNHLPGLIERFDTMPPMGQREIVRAASHASQRGWLRSLKGLPAQDPWVRRAITMAATTWSDDERVHWAKSQKGKYGFVDELLVGDLAKPKGSRTLRKRLVRTAKKDSRRVR